MGFRFFKRKKIAPGITVNISKSGPSLTLGGKGARHTIGPKGSRTTVGIPGTGISFTKQHTAGQKGKGTKPASSAHSRWGDEIIALGPELDKITARLTDLSSAIEQKDISRAKLVIDVMQAETQVVRGSLLRLSPPRGFERVQQTLAAGINARLEGLGMMGTALQAELDRPEQDNGALFKRGLTAYHDGKRYFDQAAQMVRSAR